jgi:hypothetical protein
MKESGSNCLFKPFHEYSGQFSNNINRISDAKPPAFINNKPAMAAEPFLNI